MATEATEALRRYNMLGQRIRNFGKPRGEVLGKEEHQVFHRVLVAPGRVQAVVQHIGARAQKREKLAPRRARLHEGPDERQAVSYTAREI